MEKKFEGWQVHPLTTMWLRHWLLTRIDGGDVQVSQCISQNTTSTVVSLVDDMLQTKRMTIVVKCFKFNCGLCYEYITCLFVLEHVAQCLF
jgi:hypothetical protein